MAELPVSLILLPSIAGLFGGREPGSRLSVAERARIAREVGPSGFAALGAGQLPRFETIFREQREGAGGARGGGTQRAPRRMSDKEIGAARQRLQKSRGLDEIQTAKILERQNLPQVVREVRVPRTGSRALEAAKEELGKAVAATAAALGTTAIGSIIFTDPARQAGPPPPISPGDVGPPQPTPPPPFVGPPAPIADAGTTAVPIAPGDSLEEIALPPGITRRAVIGTVSPPVSPVTAPAPAPAPVGVLGTIGQILRSPAALLAGGVIAAVSAAPGRTRSQQLGIRQTGQPTVVAAPQPALQLQPQAAVARTGRDPRCEKRRRENRKTCWEGFYREFSNRTKFTRWTKVDCQTRKIIEER